MTIDNSDKEAIIVTCSQLNSALALMFILHIVNFAATFVCLAGLDKHVCTSLMLVLFLVSNIIIVGWTQTTYFKSMQLNCINVLPEAYLWLMFESLFFYVFTACVICYFFRKHC
jgi:hypothetical protein